MSAFKDLRGAREDSDKARSVKVRFQVSGKTPRLGMTTDMAAKNGYKESPPLAAGERICSDSFGGKMFRKESSVIFCPISMNCRYRT
jgi:hypothetical protein